MGYAPASKIFAQNMDFYEFARLFYHRMVKKKDPTLQWGKLVAGVGFEPTAFRL
jgi:hypothetical protein